VRRLPFAACLVSALLALLAGCGGSPRASAPPKLPGRLAESWAVRAEAIAAAAERGNDCRARRLAGSLATEVALKRGKIPRRLRTQLLGAVEALSGRITCVPLTPAPKGPKPPKKPKKPHEKRKGPHGHGGPGEGGDG
jgi:hypothetical protein